jgi:uncharacterized membrane protein
MRNKKDPQQQQQGQKEVRKTRPTIHQNQANFPKGSNQVESLSIEYHHGPFPSPDKLNEYEKLMPGVSEKFLKAFSDAHDESIQTSRASREFKSKGQLFGFVVVIVFALAGCFTFYLSPGISGAIPFIIAGTLAAIFVLNRVPKNIAGVGKAENEK